MTAITKRLMYGLMAAFAVVALAVSIAGCSGETTVLAGENGDDGSYKVVAEGCAEGEYFITSFEVREGEGLFIHAEMEEGTLHASFGAPLLEDETIEDQPIGEDGIEQKGIVFETDLTGTTDQQVELDPGFYSLKVEGGEGKATGTVVFTSQVLD